MTEEEEKVIEEIYDVYMRPYIFYLINDRFAKPLKPETPENLEEND
jgi:hypothetical protein